MYALFLGLLTAFHFVFYLFLAVCIWYNATHFFFSFLHVLLLFFGNSLLLFSDICSSSTLFSFWNSNYTYSRILKIIAIWILWAVFISLALIFMFLSGQFQLHLLLSFDCVSSKYDLIKGACLSGWCAYCTGMRTGSQNP